MRNQNPSRLIKIAAILLFAVPFFPWSKASAQQNQGPQQDALDVLGYQSTLQEKLGRDDGASFIIHFGGDTHGNLDACG
jgi:hypothetical protein